MTTVDFTPVARAASPGRYPVNIRLTVPFLPRPFFITLIVGPERRSPSRLRAERELHPLNTWGNFLLFVCTTTVVTTATLFASLVFAAL